MSDNIEDLDVVFYKLNRHTNKNKNGKVEQVTQHT